MKSISTRLLAIMLVISAIGMAVITVVNAYKNGKSIRKESLNSFSLLAKPSSETINTWLKQQTEYIDAVVIGFTNISDLSHDEILDTLVLHMDAKDDFFDVYIGYPDGSAIFASGWDYDPNNWQANQRGWYKNATANPYHTVITDLYKDAQTGEFIITVSRAVIINGTIVGVVAADIFATYIKEVVLKSKVGDGSYSFLTNAEGGLIVHPNPDYAPYLDANKNTVFHNVFEIENGHFAKLTSQLYDNEAVTIKGIDGVNRRYMANSTDIGWIVYTTVPIGTINQPVYDMIIVSAIVFAIVMLFAGIFIYFTIKSMIVRPINDVTAAANTLSSGDTGVSFNGKYIGEIKLLVDSFKSMEEFNARQTDWLEEIADGNLTFDVQPRSEKDRTAHAISDMLGHLNDMLAGINDHSIEVAESSKNLSENSMDLAEGASKQASVISKLSETVEEIEEKTNQSVYVAREAADLSVEIKKTAENGTSRMNYMMTAVNEINEASAQIGKVIKVIDDIAFQTNILALNAAVEAARAGEYGKGFAVVAEEVRNLASKSADAAKDTGSLIENSIEKANLGLSIATETADSLKDIVVGINRSAEIIEKIAFDSDTQETAIKQLYDSIHQISEVVQQNSATAEESSAAAVMMNSQSQQLKDLISRFKTKHY
ncbi:MAG: methyl-accepting chemotaxis protein [Oscillospiraceae bacterium]|nr:methyl-accepting chemotaxis protein [Oscillospiraceae bacterium]